MSINDLIISTEEDPNNKGMFILKIKFPFKQKDNPAVSGFELELDGFIPLDPFYDGIGFWYQIIEMGDNKHLLYWTSEKSLDYKSKVIDYLDDKILSTTYSYLEVKCVTEYLTEGLLGEAIFSTKHNLNR